jgi:hypothetical protein
MMVTAQGGVFLQPQWPWVVLGHHDFLGQEKAFVTIDIKFLLIQINY